MKQGQNHNPIDIVLSKSAWDRVKQYTNELNSGKQTPGKNLKARLPKVII